MIVNSDKKYKCPYCSQTSSRRYNINIHTQRKHHPALAKHWNQPLDPYFSYNFKELDQFSYDLNSSKNNMKKMMKQKSFLQDEDHRRLQPHPGPLWTLENSSSSPFHDLAEAPL